MGWKGESRRHSLSRKGIKTNIDKTKRLSVRNFVARGLYLNEQRLNAIASDWNEGNIDSYGYSIDPGERMTFAVMNINYRDGSTQAQIVGHGDTPEEAEKVLDNFRIRLDELSASGCMKSSGNIKHFGSQAREKIEDTDEKYRKVQKKGKEVVLYNPDSNAYERWYKNDDYAGYVIEIDGVGYEFANTMKKGHVFKVWSGRYEKIVEAKDHQDAIKQSGYVDADQVDRIG